MAATGAGSCTPAFINNPVWSPTQPVLADKLGIPANTPNSTTTLQSGTLNYQVMIPAAAQCSMASPCTLQVMMIMTDHTMPGQCNYHHCANMAAAGSATGTGGMTGTTDAGTSGQGGASGGTGGKTGAGGSMTTGAGGSSTGTAGMTGSGSGGAIAGSGGTTGGGAAGSTTTGAGGAPSGGQDSGTIGGGGSKDNSGGCAIGGGALGSSSGLIFLAILALRRRRAKK
jgi:hypothetical protein